jgi:mannose-6-phosphate isomerase
MSRIFKLINSIKRYDWGSPDWIPQLIGADNQEKTPWAELWMGIHPEGPSQIKDTALSLLELIGQDPSRYLGKETYKRFGALPFLFKLLAAGKPLSIQAHPSIVQAQTGWARENQTGIPLKAFNRNYKDPNHKPEILCALRNFRAMAGFREPAEIAKLLDLFARNAPASLTAPLNGLIGTLNHSGGPSVQLRTFFKNLFALPPSAVQEISDFGIQQQQKLFNTCPEYAKEWEMVAYFASLYPGDPGVIAPLYLNLIDLRPHEGIYIPAGVLHAYISGFGVELMANSDNVLRGGLTSKYIDLNELLNILDFTPFAPEILTPCGITYPSHCQEFALSVLNNQGTRAYFPKTGPSIVIVTQGCATLTDKKENERCTLHQGESAFISFLADPEELVLTGGYTLYAASAGDGIS